MKGEPTMAEKVIPFLLKLLSFSIVRELRCKNGLNVLFIGREDDPLADDQRFDSIWILRITALMEHLPPELMVAVMCEVPYCPEES